MFYITNYKKVRTLYGLAFQLLESKKYQKLY
jgi:hypothetical protein